MCRSDYLPRANANIADRSRRIGVAGASAGGHLAELVATAEKSEAGLEGDGGSRKSEPGSGSVCLLRSLGFHRWGSEFQHHSRKVVVKLFRGNEKEKPELYKVASPIKHVSEDDLRYCSSMETRTTLFRSTNQLKCEGLCSLRLKVEFIPVKNGHDWNSSPNPILPPITKSIRVNFVFQTVSWRRTGPLKSRRCQTLAAR